MPSEALVQLLSEQMDEIQEEHPDLELVIGCSDEVFVRGKLRFSIEHECHTISDEYHIKALVREDYPLSPPIVWETGDIVPGDFHKMKAGNLCLGAPVEVRRILSEIEEEEKG